MRQDGRWRESLTRGDIEARGDIGLKLLQKEREKEGIRK